MKKKTLYALSFATTFLLSLSLGFSADVNPPTFSSGARQIGAGVKEAGAAGKEKVVSAGKHIQGTGQIAGGLAKSTGEKAKADTASAWDRIKSAGNSAVSTVKGAGNKAVIATKEQATKMQEKVNAQGRRFKAWNADRNIKQGNRQAERGRRAKEELARRDVRNQGGYLGSNPKESVELQGAQKFNDPKAQQMPPSYAEATGMDTLPPHYDDVVKIIDRPIPPQEAKNLPHPLAPEKIDRVAQARKGIDQEDEDFRDRTEKREEWAAKMKKQR